MKHTSEVQRQRRLAIQNRAAEFEAIQERLLTSRNAETIDESPLAAKQAQLHDETATVAATLALCGEGDAEDFRSTLGVFQFAYNTSQIWGGSREGEKESKSSKWWL